MQASKEFLDGLVELRSSGKSCPPDYVGPAGNMSTVWFRINGGKWEPTSFRSMARNAKLLENAKSAAEFRQLVS